ncbi:DUF4062 domain-containing protein [Bacteroides faecichinchillae]|uniref:DUF4062 domain-containing protein n=1 Tax=Bacteroides faecichinchillae TaxID=871325 RepID=UPI003513723C
MKRRRFKTIRVFVSSTFKDLKEERDYLFLHAFRELETYCKSKGWKFQPIDLRWGISANAAFKNKTMQTCLEELRHCQDISPRPNFITLLGDVYGWKPLPAELDVALVEKMFDDFSDADIQLFKDHYEYIDYNSIDANSTPKPVYVLVERHGAYLDNYELYRQQVEEPLHKLLADWAALHLENPDNIVTNCSCSNCELSEEQKNRLKMERSATEQEIYEGIFCADLPENHVYAYLKNGMEGDDPDVKRLKKLLTGRLKENTIAFTKVEELDRSIYHNLKRVIDDEIASYVEDDEELINEFFANERIAAFRGRTTELEAIDGYINSTDERTPFLVTGEAGCGKTTLLAFSAAQQRKADPECLVIQRFIGVNKHASRDKDIVMSICKVIIQRFGMSEWSIPTKPDELNGFFMFLLGSISPEKKVVIYIDALDQLDNDSSKDYLWLPMLLQENVKIILSCLPNAEYETLVERGCRTCRIEKMDEVDAESILRFWLQREKRTISDWQMKKVMSLFRQSGANMLYLRLCFEKLRKSRSYDSLNDMVGNLQNFIMYFFEKVLTEQEGHSPILVKKIISYLYVAKNGLNDIEILELLSKDVEFIADFNQEKFHANCGDKVPIILWLGLYNDMRHYLSERITPGGEVVTFYHRCIRETVKEMYLFEGAQPSEEKIHSLEADYFGSQPWYYDVNERVVNQRKTEEYPYHLALSGEKERLVSEMCSLSFMRAKSVARNVQGLIDDFYRALLTFEVFSQQDQKMQERLKQYDLYAEQLITSFTSPDKNPVLNSVSMCRKEIGNDVIVTEAEEETCLYDRLFYFYHFILFMQSELNELHDVSPGYIELLEDYYRNEKSDVGCHDIAFELVSAVNSSLVHMSISLNQRSLYVETIGGDFYQYDLHSGKLVRRLDVLLCKECHDFNMSADEKFFFCTDLKANEFILFSIDEKRIVKSLHVDFPIGHFYNRFLSMVASGQPPHSLLDQISLSSDLHHVSFRLYGDKICCWDIEKNAVDILFDDLNSEKKANIKDTEDCMSHKVTAGFLPEYHYQLLISMHPIISALYLNGLVVMMAYAESYERYLGDKLFSDDSSIIGCHMYKLSEWIEESKDIYILASGIAVNSKYIAFILSDQRVLVGEMSVENSISILNEFHLPDAKVEMLDFQYYHIEVSTDAKRVLCITKNGNYVYDTEQNNLYSVLLDYQSIRFICMTADASKVALFADDGLLHITDLELSSLLSVAPEIESSDSVRRSKYDLANGNEVFVDYKQKSVILENTDKEVETISFKEKIEQFSVSANSKYFMVVTFPSCTVHAYDFTGRCIWKQNLKKHKYFFKRKHKDGSSLGIEFDFFSDMKHLVIVAYKKVFYLSEDSDVVYTCPLKINDSFNNILCLNDGKTFWIYNSNDLDSVVNCTIRDGSIAWKYADEYFNIGHYFADGRRMLVRLNSQQRRFVAQHSDIDVDIVDLPDGFYIYDIVTKKYITVYVQENIEQNTWFLSTDEKYIVIQRMQHFRIYDSVTGKLLNTLPAFDFDCFKNDTFYFRSKQRSYQVSLKNDLEIVKHS